MDAPEIITYTISDLLELNLSYMPFIHDGGLFIPVDKHYSLGHRVNVDLELPNRKEKITIEGKVVWITPNNALHHVLPGIGIQFVGINTQTIRSLIEAQLDPAIEIGGYVYGVTEDFKKDK